MFFVVLLSYLVYYIHEISNNILCDNSNNILYYTNRYVSTLIGNDAWIEKMIVGKRS